MKPQRTPMTIVLCDESWMMTSAPTHAPGCRQDIDVDVYPECVACRYFWHLSHAYAIGIQMTPVQMRPEGGV